ncbi:hypothetical protein CYY_003340 [Polysphondylium violaceum]|uniref:Uncharacterized protein n=1 Tax=Polysphondylium violaceum TaxID=133409 RepID=A0A8J4PYM2_9MYCE|nr:hypothetical protein CYY_003340 [Polysphondylium violaceum]
MYKYITFILLSLLLFITIVNSTSFTCSESRFPPFVARNETCASKGPFCKPYLQCNLQSTKCERIYSNETCVNNACGDASLTCIDGFCRPKGFLTFGSACNETYQCMSLNCANGICQNSPSSASNTQCSTNSQCNTGICVNSTCNVYSCSGDEQCPNNSFCFESKCKAKVEKGGVCGSSVCQMPYSCSYQNSTSTVKTCIEPLSLQQGDRCDPITFLSHFDILTYPCDISKGLYCSIQGICTTYVQTNDTCPYDRECTYTEICDCNSYTSPTDKVCKPVVNFNANCSKEVAIVNECIANNTIIMTDLVTQVAFSPLYDKCGTKLCELNTQCFIAPSSAIMYYCDNYYPHPPRNPAAVHPTAPKAATVPAAAAHPMTAAHNHPAMLPTHLHTTRPSPPTRPPTRHPAQPPPAPQPPLAPQLAKPTSMTPTPLVHYPSHSHSS